MPNQDNNAVTTSRCPECGCKEFVNENLVGTGYRECKSCKQEWWTDIDYSTMKEEAIYDNVVGVCSQNKEYEKTIKKSVIRAMQEYADLCLSQSSAKIEGLKEELDKYREALTDRNNKVAHWKGLFEHERERINRLVDAMRLALGDSEEQEEGKYWQLIIDIEAIVESYQLACD